MPEQNGTKLDSQRSIASRAAGVGFDWENPEQVIEKLHEELAEFDEARRKASGWANGR